jgi:hypothetical protein
LHVVRFRDVRSAQQLIVEEEDMASVAEKLRIAPRSRVRLIERSPGDGATLGELPSGARFVGPAEEADVVIVFAADSTELRASLPMAAATAAGDRLLWVAYPKASTGMSTDLSRDGLTALTDEIAGLTGVALVSIDETWSAMRLRDSSRYRD